MSKTRNSELYPGVGDALTVGAGGGGSGALIQSLFDTVGLGCGAGCTISGGTGGYMTLSSGWRRVAVAVEGTACTTLRPEYDRRLRTVTSSHGTSTGSFLRRHSPRFLFCLGNVGTFSGGLLISSISCAPQVSAPTPEGALSEATLSLVGSGDAITISLNSNCSQGGVCQGLVDQGSISMQTTVPEPANFVGTGRWLLALGTDCVRNCFAAN